MSDLEKINWFGNQISNETVKDESYPKISIVTPSFNQGKYIEQTILSILNQNYPNLEYIIIDGGSKDESISILKKYEKYISYWVSEPDKGQTDAINKGFLKCTGDIFNWLNSDDIYAPGVLHEIAKMYRENPNVSCFCGREDRFLKDKILNTSYGTSIENSIEATICKAHIDQPSTFFTLRSIQHVFPIDATLRYCMDNQIWLNYLLSNGQDSILKSQNTWVYFRYHNDSKTVKFGHGFRFEIHRLIISALISVDPEFLLEAKNRNIDPVAFKKVNVNIQKEQLAKLVFQRVDKYKDDISLLYYEYAGYYRMMKLKKNTRTYLWMAIKNKPFRLIYWKSLLKNIFA